MKRVYEKPEPNDGVRFLVDRLWPRGLEKAAVPLDAWVKEAGPSDRLRKWFAHDPRKWMEFQRRYFQELDDDPEIWKPIRDAAKHGAVTLLYSARDAEHNNASALKEFLKAKLTHKKVRLAHKKVSAVAQGESA